MKYIAFLSLFLAFQSTIFAQVKLPDIVWTQYTDEKMSFEVPESWDIQSMKHEGVWLMAISPLDADNDRFRENVVVMKQALNQPFAQYIQEDIKKSIGNLDVNVVTDKWVKHKETGGYHHYIYEMEQSGMILRFDFHYFQKGEEAITFIFTCETVNAPSYASLSDKLLHSVRFK